MKTIITETNVYKFEELSDKAKKNALQNLWDLNVDYGWWDYTHDDANTIGMEITSFDLDRHKECNADIYDPQKTAQLILENHGEVCDTYKLAKSFLTEVQPIQETADLFEDDDDTTREQYDANSDLYDDIKTLETEFKRALCEEYANILQKEYEYLTGEAAIIESIESNDYDFTEDGKLF